MARPDFFNDNINREFPFQEGTVGSTGTVKNIANLLMPQLLIAVL